MKKYTNIEQVEINTITKFFGIPKSISTLFVNRNINTDEKIASYLKKDYNLSNPLQFPTIKNAIKRINKALISDEKILIFGDYDVDGMIATSMVYLYLLRANAHVDFYIPDREDGYGFNDKTVKKIIDLYSPDLVISVDTGITAKKEIQCLKNSNIDVIVTDHHEVNPEKIPNAISVINPKFIKDDKFNLNNLSGGGVAFYLLRAINTGIFSEKSRQNMVDYLVLTMITTISDMMELKGDNRIIVEHGLNYLFETNIIGLNQILDVIDFYEYPTAIDISMQLAPIINSAGRMNNPNVVIDLFTDDTLNVFEKVQAILKINNERKELTKEYINKIKLLENNKLIIVDDNKIPAGIVGLIATKLCYEKEKPTLIIGELDSNNKRRCSMRSLKGVELTSLLITVNDIIDGGGHDFALGFTISDENINEFIHRVHAFINNKQIKKINEIEIMVDFSEINESFIRLLYSMEPFGKGNERPMVKITNIPSFIEAKKIKKEHFKLEISKNVSGICFFPNDELMNKYEKIVSSKEGYSIDGCIYSVGDKLKILIKDMHFLI